MITLRQLRYLTSLARHRHFGRAAQDCAVTQPALSMQVRALEREIGTELVERRPGEIALTDTGLDVAQRAEQILTATRDLADGADMETLALFDDAFLLAVPAADVLSARSGVGVEDVDQHRLILLEEGHCLRDQALAFCATSRRDAPAGLGATSLATVMQMVANGYGVTLLPEVAVDAEVRDKRVKLLRFSAPEPARTIGLAWRRTSPRRKDFQALGQIIIDMIGGKTQVRPSTRTASGNRSRP